jgi:hypothetical protein
MSRLRGRCRSHERPIELSNDWNRGIGVDDYTRVVDLSHLFKTQGVRREPKSTQHCDHPSQKSIVWSFGHRLPAPSNRTPGMFAAPAV